MTAFHLVPTEAPYDEMAASRVGSWCGDRRSRRAPLCLLVAFVALLGAASQLRAHGQQSGADRTRGVVLTYELDPGEAPDGRPGKLDPERIPWDSLVRALEARLRSAGAQGCSVKRVGDARAEIVVYETDPAKVTPLKRWISATGVLEFRVVANSWDHEWILAAAKRQAADPAQRRRRVVVDSQGKRVGFWALAGRAKPVGDIRPLRVSVTNCTIRNAATGELVALPETVDRDGKYAVERHLAEQQIPDIEVLMATDDGFDVMGVHIRQVSRDVDETGRPCVDFVMTDRGAGLMGGLTGTALPDRDRGVYRMLGIVLDGELLSAPRVMSLIADRGRITGAFTQEEVDYLVGIVQAGALPIALKKTPISEKPFGPASPPP